MQVVNTKKGVVYDDFSETMVKSGDNKLSNRLSKGRQLTVIKINQFRWQVSDKPTEELSIVWGQTPTRKQLR